MSEVLNKYNEIIKKYKDNYLYYNELPLILRNNRDIVKYELVYKKQLRIIQNIPYHLRDDEEIMTYAIKADSIFFTQASKRLKNKEDWVFKNIKIINGYYSSVSYRLRKKESFIIERMKSSGFLELKYLKNIKKAVSIIKKEVELYNLLSKDMQRKKDVYMTFFNHVNLSYISNKNALKKNKDIINIIKKRLRLTDKVLENMGENLPSINKKLLENPIILCLIDNKYTDNKDLMLKLVKNNGIFYNFINDEFQEDETFINCVLSIIPILPRKHASNKDLIINHVKSMYYVDLSYVDKIMWKDEEFIKICIDNNVSVFNYVDKSFKSSTKLLNWLLDSKEHDELSYYLEKMDKNLINQEEYVKRIVAKSSCSYNLLNVKNRSRKDIFFTLDLESSRDDLLIPRKLLKDKDVVNELINKKIYSNFKDLPVKERNNHNIIQRYLDFNKNIYLYINKEEQEREDNVVKLNGGQYKYLPLKYKKRKDIIENSLKTNLNISNVYGSYKYDKEIILTSLLAQTINFKNISKKLIKNKEDFKWILEQFKVKKNEIDFSDIYSVWEMILPNWKVNCIKKIINNNDEYKKAFYSLYDNNFLRSKKNNFNNVLDKMHDKVMQKELEKEVIWNVNKKNRKIKF